MDAIDFGPYAKNKMATIKLFKMYAIDTTWAGSYQRTS